MRYFAIAAALAPILCMGGSIPSPDAGEVPPEFGIASWYGYPFHGRIAADGSLFDMDRISAAHRTLPLGTWVRVTNLENEKTIDVRITDRGPFIDGRIIDLSRAAARAIDLIDAGVARVRLELISATARVSRPPATHPDVARPLPPMIEDGRFAVQVGAFREKRHAERLRDRMEQEHGYARIAERPGDPVIWRVFVGSTSSRSEANTLAAALQAEVGAAFVVQVDEHSTTSVAAGQ